MASLGPEHVSRVRILYKAILRLHKGMPPELQALGDQYVKDEFKRHRDAELQFVPMFMNSWTVCATFACYNVYLLMLLFTANLKFIFKAS